MGSGTIAVTPATIADHRFFVIASDSVVSRGVCLGLVDPRDQWFFRRVYRADIRVLSVRDVASDRIDGHQ